MKTKRSARKVRKLQITLFCLAIAALIGIEWTVGGSLAARLAQATSRQTESAPVPTVDLSVLVAAAR